jgi:conjugative relaxase-like TrwC/TraI family protein
MLNIGKLRPGGAAYYLETVASSVEAYYTGAGEAPGRWVGAASARLALAGLVDAETLRTVLAGQHPGEGLALVGAGRTVPGFDLTFRAPKSVSLLWALADEHTAGQVRDAHDAAVLAALDYLQRHAAFTRRGKGGVERVAVDGLVGAALRHRSSRANDPLLHTHVLVANLAYTADDGQWRSLDGRQLYVHAKTAGYLHQAQLRAELTERLGVRFGPVTNGYADLHGVPREVIEAFSRRRAQILTSLAELGHRSARAAQIATLVTRAAKTHTRPGTLRATWRIRAAELGFGPREVAALTGTGARELASDTPDLAGGADWLLGPRGLTANTSTFTRREVLQGWCGRLTGGASVFEVERLADRLLADTHPGTIRLTGNNSPVRSMQAGLRLVDGRWVSGGPADDRYSTPELLAIEQQLIDTALARLEVGAARLPAAVTKQAIGTRSLSGEQQQAVMQLTGSGHGIEVVVGRAGTGKTYMLGAAHHAWRQTGVEVVGCALAARAARELEAGSGIRSTTIDRLLADLARPGGGLPAGGVLVVDEAGMVGTRTLARLADATGAADAKLVLVGDHHQLPELEAGGGFAGLARRLPAIELTVNRRQHQPWEIAALDQLRHGDLAAAVGAYQHHGRIVVADTDEALREQLVDDWYATLVQGRDAVMVAARHTDIDDLNARARTRAATNGQLTGPSLADGGRTFQVGERVLCLRNHRHLGVVNGTTGTITAIDHTARSLTLQPADTADAVRLPAAYLDNGHLTHGYALTGHKAQGLTCDATFVLGSDEIYREWGYVALSRGRQDNRLYVIDDPHQPDPTDGATHPEFHQTDQRPATERLTADLHRSHRQMLALDHLPDAPAEQVGRDLEVAGYLSLALGVRPAGGDAQEIWDHAAEAIEHYRHGHLIDDLDRPLGGPPTDPVARAGYQQALRELLGARRAIRAGLPCGPETHVERGRDIA